MEPPSTGFPNSTIPRRLGPTPRRPLGVNIDRKIRGAAERSHVIDELLATHGHVLSSQRGSEAPARGGQGLESERGEESTGPEIVRVGHDERSVEVKRAKSSSDAVRVHPSIMDGAGRRDKRNFGRDRPGTKSGTRARSWEGTVWDGFGTQLMATARGRAVRWQPQPSGLRRAPGDRSTQVGSPDETEHGDPPHLSLG